LTVRGFEPIIRIPEYLSMTNKHPASTLILEKLGDPLTSEKLIELIQSRLKLCKDLSVPAPVSWAQKMVDRVNEFIKDLLSNVR
jgi:hypothetical protein